MNPTTLEVLTLELFEMVLQYLELDDLQQLRLVSRETCLRTTRDRFLSFTARQRVELTPTDLKHFALMTSQGCRVGCSVRHSTLVGVLYDSWILEEVLGTDPSKPLPKGGYFQQGSTPRPEAQIIEARKHLDELYQSSKDLETFRKAGNDLTLLFRILRNIASEPRHKLDTLSLDVEVYNGAGVVDENFDWSGRSGWSRWSPARYSERCRDQIFLTAAKTFKVISLALRDAEPYIHHLEAFKEQCGPNPCELPYDTFSQMGWTAVEHSWSTFKTLKTLSLGVSDRALSSDIEAFESTSGNDAALWEAILLREAETDARHISSLVQLADLCPQLENLHILWYRLLPDTSVVRPARYSVTSFGPSASMWHRTIGEPQWRARQQYMHQLALAPLFKCLRTFHLGGLSLQPKDLLLFVQRHQPGLREIDLDNVQDVDSTFTSLFSWLACPDSVIQSIRLKDLQENFAAVYFGIEQRSEFTRLSGDQLGNNIIERFGEDVKKQIGYSTRGSRPGSWHATRRRLFNFGSVAAGMAHPDLAMVEEMPGRSVDCTLR